jgi:hypothetical protein
MTAKTRKAKPVHIEDTWTAMASKELLGRKVERVRYMTEDEAQKLGWSHRPIVLELDNGTCIWPSRDDEGNDAGSMFGFNTITGEELTFPVTRTIRL